MRPAVLGGPWSIRSAAWPTSRTPAASILLLENHMENQVTSAAQMVELVQALDHPRVGIIHDPANLTIMGEPDDRSAFELQQPYNPSRAPERHPPGRGGNRGYAAALFDAGQAPVAPLGPPGSSKRVTKAI